ncbi:MAG: hypothetical protein H7123_05210, partial [Thermoleophilia bacterium]|nr:hypothetical protein [Thermoleophilia bacterium]
DTDRIIEPTRPIPRGLVSEREVDALSVALLLVEFGLFAAIGQLTLVIWLLAAGFTVLMRVEFFVGEWLDRHVLTYAISHMVSMGLVLASLIAAGIDTLGMAEGVNATEVVASTDIVLVCIGGFVLGVGFELGRKFEKYAGAHGTAGWILLAACPTLAVALFAYASTDWYSSWVTITLWATAGVSLVGHTLLVMKRPKPANDISNIGKPFREAIEALPGVAGLVTYLVLAIAGVQALNW